MGFGNKNTSNVPSVPTTGATTGGISPKLEKHTYNLSRKLDAIDASLGGLSDSTKGITQFQKEYQSKLKDLLRAADKAEEAYTSGGKMSHGNLSSKFKERLQTLKDIGVFAEESSKVYTAIDKSLRKLTASGLKGDRRHSAIGAFQASIKSGLALLDKDVPKQATTLSKTISHLIDSALEKSKPVIFASPSGTGYTKKDPIRVKLERELSKMRGERESREAKALAWSQQNFTLKRGGALQSGGFTSMSPLQPTGYFPIPSSRALVPISTIQAGGLYPNMAGRQFGPKDITAYEKMNTARMQAAYEGMVPPTARDVSRLRKQESNYRQSLAAGQMQSEWANMAPLTREMMAQQKAMAASEAAVHKADLNTLFGDFKSLMGPSGGKFRAGGTQLDQLMNWLSTPAGWLHMHAFSEWGAQHGVGGAHADLSSRSFARSLPKLVSGVTGMGNPDPRVLHPGVIGMGNPFVSGEPLDAMGPSGPSGRGFFSHLGGFSRAAIELGIPVALYEGWKWMNNKGQQALAQYEPMLAAARITGTTGGIGPLEQLFSKTNRAGNLAIDPALAKLGYGSIADVAKVISAGGTPFHAMAGLATSTMLAQSPLTGFINAGQYNQAFGAMQAAGLPEAMTGNYDRLRAIYEKSIREGMKGYLPPKTIWENMNKFLQQDIGLGIVPSAKTLGQYASFGAMSVNPAIRSGAALMQAQQGWQQFGLNPTSNSFLYQTAWSDYYRTTGSAVPTAAGMKKWAESLGMGNVITNKGYQQAAKYGGMGLVVLMRMLGAGGANPMGYAGVEERFLARSGLGGGLMAGLFAPNLGASTTEWYKAGLLRRTTPNKTGVGMGTDFSDVLKLHKFVESPAMSTFLDNGAGIARGMVSSYKAITLEAANATVNATGNTIIQVNSATVDLIDIIDKGAHWALNTLGKTAAGTGGSTPGPGFMGPYHSVGGIFGRGTKAP